MNDDPMRGGTESFLGGWLPDEGDETQITNITDIKRVDARRIAKDRASLTLLSGTDFGRVIAIDDKVTLGRWQKCDVVVDDSSVSRIHAVISSRGDMRWILEDKKSRNGTFVNGERVETHELGDADQIQLGATVRMRFSITSGEEESVLLRMYESSVRDGLTGAYNRKYFEERLSAEVSYATRHQAELTLILYDIDHFKRVNDEHGHLMGDSVLRQLTDAVKTAIRTEDVLARYGGEEFAVIARGTSGTGAARLGERIRAKVERLVVDSHHRKLKVTVSVGVSMLSSLEEKSGKALIAAADIGLYAAKRSGRNRVIFPS